MPKFAHQEKTEVTSQDPQSPYLCFTPKEWRQYRSDTPLTLSEQELTALRGFNERISLREVEDIYLPLSRLLNLHVEAAQALHAASSQFLNHQHEHVPFIIGISGSVAVGKSTTSRVLQTLLSRWPSHPKVDLITTDGFLYPNAELESRGIMHRKGFPESFNQKLMLETLTAIKSGKKRLQVPLYSHEVYDIVTNGTQIINNPDIIIFEGLNLLNNSAHNPDAHHIQYMSDYIDFSIYVDAETCVIENWFLERFKAFRSQAARKPERYFYRFWEMPDHEAIQYARNIWKKVNEANLLENILPFKKRADLILSKSADHSIQSVALRR